MGMFGDNVGAEEFALFGAHAGGAARGRRGRRGGGAACRCGEGAGGGFYHGVTRAGGGFGGWRVGEEEFFAGVVDGPVEFDSVDAAWGLRGVEDSGDVGAVDFFDFGFEGGEGVESLGFGVGFGECGEGGEEVDGGDFHFAEAWGVADLAGAEEGFGPEADGLAFFTAADEFDEVAFEEEHGGVLPARGERAKKNSAERGGLWREFFDWRLAEFSDGGDAPEGEGEEQRRRAAGGVIGDIPQSDKVGGCSVGAVQDAAQGEGVERHPEEHQEDAGEEDEGGNGAKHPRADGASDALQQDQEQQKQQREGDVEENREKKADRRYIEHRGPGKTPVVQRGVVDGNGSECRIASGDDNQRGAKERRKKSGASKSRESPCTHRR